MSSTYNGWWYWCCLWQRCQEEEDWKLCSGCWSCGGLSWPRTLSQNCYQSVKKQLQENVHLFIFTQFLLRLQDLDSHIFAPMTLVMTRSSCREQMGRSPAPSTRCCTSDLPSWSCSPRRCSQTLEVLKMVWYYFSNNDIGNWLVLWCWNDCSFKTSTSIKIHFHLNASTP